LGNTQELNFSELSKSSHPLDDSTKLTKQSELYNSSASISADIYNSIAPFSVFAQKNIDLHNEEVQRKKKNR